MDFRICNYCHKPAELACRRCGDSYCARGCQMADWPQHKLFCFPMPSLVKPSNEMCLESAMQPASPSSRPTSPLMKFQNMKLSLDCDALKSDIRPLVGGHKENTSNVNNDSIKINNIAPGTVASVDRSTMQDKMGAQNSVKPAYYKTDNVDAASIRKPGMLSQVLPKQTTVEPPKQAPVEPPKQAPVEPLKQAPVASSKQEKIEPPKQVDRPKQAAVEIPKEEKSEPKPLATIEVMRGPKKIDLTPPSSAATQPKAQQPGPWMKPYPMEENEFVDVIVQFVASDDTAWVTLAKLDDQNNDLLRLIHKNISATTTPDPSDVHVNALFLVKFEEVHYRCVILQPVSAKGTVSVRLVDFGNDLDVTIDELKSPTPAMAEKNAYAFPIKFKSPRKVGIGNSIKVKKDSIDANGVIAVTVAGDRPMFTMKDIDVVPIPLGTNKDLVCLDFSQLASGYVSACVLDAKAVKFVEDMGPKMSAYCKQVAGEYSPQVDELCLVQFLDNEWYRAVALKVIDGNQFEIMFIDYGNIITVNSSAIRQLVDDYTHPCLMNACYIKDFPKAPTKDDIHKAAVYFNGHQTFSAETVEKNADDKYVIRVTI